MTHVISKQLDRSEFPHRVWDLGEPPQEMYLVGELPRGPAVAVIGTRHPTCDALKYTEELVQALARQGLSVWSGGAKGIDIAAHRAALGAGAKSVVVAPAGWEHPYPPEHADDYRAVVARGGAYLALVPPAQEARLHQFFARNAVLMALVDVVVIVQAGLRSGARNAAKVARRLGRTVFVAPSCPWVPQGLGCNLEIGLGARVLVSPKDVVKSLSCYGITSAAVPAFDEAARNDFAQAVAAPLTAGAVAERRVFETSVKSDRRVSPTFKLETELDAELRLILSAIESGAHHLDDLCARTGLLLPVVQSDVLRLTLLGLVRTDQAGAVKIVSS